MRAFLLICFAHAGQDVTEASAQTIKGKRRVFKSATSKVIKGGAIPMNLVAKTTIKKKTLDPSWHEQFAFSAKEARTLAIVVWDWDRLGSNDLCAVVNIDVMQLNLKNQVPYSFTVPLQPQGSLTLQLEYVDGQSLFGLDLESVTERETQRVPLIVQTCAYTSSVRCFCE